MTEEPQEFWKDALRVTGSEKMDRNCMPNGFSYTPGDAYRRQSAWKKDLPVSRYVHIPSAVLPTRLIDEHVQVAKRRKLAKRSADENDAWQRNEAIRTKLLENLAAIGRNTKESEHRASSVQATEPGGLQRFPNVSDILNSTVPEVLRGDVSRYERCSGEGVEQVEEPSGRFVRTSSRIGSTSAGNLSAKENLATFGLNVKTAHSPSQTSSDLNVNSEYLEPAVNEKSFSTASSSSQPGHRSFATARQLLSSPLQSSCRETFCTIKPPLDENCRPNVRNSGNLSLAYSASPFETSIDLINRTEHIKEMDGKSCAENLDDSQPGLPAKIEVPDDKGLMGDKDWTVGMPFYVDESRRTMHTHGQERDAEFPKHAVLSYDTEDCPKQNATPNWRSYAFNGHQLSARNLSLTKLTETYRRKSRLESGPENENDSVAGRRRQIFQNRNQSSEFDYATPLLLPSETPAAPDSMTFTDDLPPGVRAGTGDGTSDRGDDLSTGTRLGRGGAALVGDGKIISRNGNHLEPLDRWANIRNPSPALKSNVGGGDFGSLKAITAFYRAMGKVEAPSSSSSSSSSNRGGRAAGDTYRRPIEDPIDLSTRVQNPQHPVYDDDDKSGNGSDYLTSYADDFSDKSSANISERAGFQRPARNITSFGEEEKSGGIPRNGSPITDLASPVKDPDDRRLPSGPASRPPAVKDSSPTSDSHLPPKKRRFQSYYDLEDTAESKSATGGSDDAERGEKWSGNSMVRSSADQTTQADDGSLKARRPPPPEEDADIKRACAADSQLIEKHNENFEQSDIIQENHWNDRWALIPDCDGDLPLHVAVAKASETLVQKCLEIMHGFGVSVDRYNKKRKTPLHLAVISRQRLIVERLLRSYASPNVCDRNGDSSIHLAVKYRCVDCLKCLVTKSSHVIDLDTRNYEGLTAIHLAVLSDELELAEILLRVGATVDVADGKTGRMPLHCAIESDNKEMVKLLLAYGANPHAITYSGHTPAHIAKNHLEMADMLELTTYRLQSITMNKDKTQQDIFAHRRWKTGKSSRLRSEATRKCVWQC